MIHEIDGKKLAFGMDWRALIEPGSYASVAADKAIEQKSPLLWHDGNADYAGFVRAADREAAANGAVYAAAEAFRRLPGLPEDALLILRSPDRNFSVIGIRGRKPLRRFDQTGITEEEVQTLYDEFGQKCGEDGFALVGDAALSFAPAITQFSINELAALADGHCLLKQPSRKPLYRKLALAAVTLAVLAFTGWKVSTVFFPPEVTPSKSPLEAYQDNVAAHAADPVVRAVDYSSWYAWARSLGPDYGGWALTKVECDFHAPNSQAATYQPWTGTPQCTTTYARSLKAFATNETFFAAAPKGYENRAVYTPGKDEWVVSVDPPAMPKVSLGAFLAHAGAARDRDLHFISILQVVENFLSQKPTLATPVPFLVPPGTSAAALNDVAYEAATWHMDGASQYTKVLGTFPHYATLTKATLTVNQKTNTTDTPYQVSLEGDVITRN